ncbi:nicotinamidase/pyrazinamidase [Corynebacterium kalinowskii]|uniref:nicotinamidase n=1 Tax=Corynebacterium kalinowskii TaxID=2675216 RepID=A0A6B8VIZ2_9CORY|nr:isochorismatase family protein [Corynebacterium kalinowskii]QGU01444.1 nicotinamidase/pyrazinamidase [Corynebacterium kalinowskii]
MTQSHESHALIVVDVQNDFCPGGSLATVEGGNVAKRIAAMLAGAHDYDLVLATKDWHIDPGSHFSDNPDFIDSWPVHCVAESDGADFHPSLMDFAFDAVFLKGEYEAAYSGFEGKHEGQSLEDYLLEKQVTSIDVVGIATDYCVRATAADGVEKGFLVRVLTDYIAPVAEQSGEKALQELEGLGVTLI